MANQNGKSEMNLEKSDVEDGANDSASVPEAKALDASVSGNSSEDEGEVIPKIVDNYYFTDDKEEPISFTVLPFDFDGDENKDGSKEQVFLWGTADSGLQKVYKQAVAWKLNLQEQKPIICVKTKEKAWIQLQKPRKSFEDTIRTVLVVAHFLHFSRKNPEASEKAHWDHLRKVFSMSDVKPTDSDLLEHLSLIDAIYQGDQKLRKSDVLKNFLDMKSKKRKLSDEEGEANPKLKKPKFVINDEESEGELGEDDGGDESDEEEDDLFDSVCAICDNGGELLCCEGPCLRSFHARRSDGVDSNCKSLGLSKAEVNEILNFYCLNCKYKQHQCFVCGKLGSSDKSSRAEVFCCVSATCGHFYHPECVSRLLVPEDEVEDLAKKIASGQQFTCPVHKCIVCKRGEKKDDEDLQFAICRRCPKTYHRKCLPSYITFEESSDDDEPQRAWDDLIPNRILIYCKKHKIDPDLGTPRRNHVIFPEVPSADKISVKRSSALSPESKTGKMPLKKNKVISPESSKEKVIKEKSTLSAQDVVSVKVPKNLKESERSTSVRKEDKYPSLEVKKSSVQKEAKSKFLEQKEGKAKVLEQEEGKIKVSEQKEAKVKALELNKSKADKELPSFKSNIKKRSIIAPSFTDNDVKNSVMEIVKRSTAGISLQDVSAKHQVPSTHQRDSKSLDKTITLGKVEGSVEAVRSALKKLEEGGSIDDAIAVCEPELLNHIYKWKNKLKVYLAPFLHGMRYTSFGRHFTKVDKLQEVVERLHWYVQNGDTIVDFCCGANDFSRIMKEKLEQSGKKCFFKNFDIIQPKNDFEFEKRDWLTVRKEELPTGTRLIMGLNPPFGVKAALANKFIDKALQFKPKLLVLIVPVETQRLDEKAEAYDLIWEDADLLKGQSFYFPGSVGSDDKQLGQWNTVAPPLYLWSRPDWTVKHKAIAIKQGHVCRGTLETQSQTEVLDAHPVQEGLGEGNAFQTLEGETNSENHIAKQDQPVSGFFTKTIDQPRVNNRESENARSKHTLEESWNKQNQASKVDSSTQKMDESNVTSNKIREEQKESQFRSESQRKDKETDVNNQCHGRSARHLEQTQARRQDRGAHDDGYGIQQHLKETSPSRERTEREIYDMDRHEKDGDIFENDRLEDRGDKDRSKRERPGRERPEKGRLEKERVAMSPPLTRLESRKDLDTDPYSDISQQRNLLNINATEPFGRAFERGPANREDLVRGFQIGSNNLGQEFGRGYQGMQGGAADEDYRRGFHRLSASAEDGFGRGIQRGPGNVDGEYVRGLSRGRPGSLEDDCGRGFLNENAAEEFGRGFHRNFGGNLESEYSVSTDLQMLQSSSRGYNRQGQHEFDSDRPRRLHDTKLPDWLAGDSSQRDVYLSDQGSHVNSAYFRNSDRGTEMQRSFMLGKQHESSSQLHSRVPYHSEAYDTGLGSSAMQRYAPRLDQQMNYARSNLHHIEQVPRSSILGTGAVNFSMDPLGFAHGPQNPFPHQSSSGWIDE